MGVRKKEGRSRGSRKKGERRGRGGRGKRGGQRVLERREMIGEQKRAAQGQKRDRRRGRRGEWDVACVDLGRWGKEDVEKEKGEGRDRSKGGTEEGR